MHYIQFFMSALESFVSNNPFSTYLIVFFGMLIEGESFFLTASIFAGEGYLRWGTLVAVSLIGMLAGDCLFYELGRVTKFTRFGEWFLRRFGRANEWLNKNFASRYVRLAFVSKYIYFVNRLTPFFAGWHAFPRKSFIYIHAGAAVVWTGVMLILSHWLGLVVEFVGVRVVLRRIEFIFLALILLFMGGEYFLKRVFTRKITRNSNSERHAEFTSSE